MKSFKKLTGTVMCLVIVLWVCSCKKEIAATPSVKHDPTAGVVSQIKNDDGFMPGKYVFFQVIQQPDAIDTTASFSINVFAKFTDDLTGIPVNAGNIVINNSQTITSGAGNLYQYSYDQNTLLKAKSYLGNYVDIQVKGSNVIDSLTRKLYIPRPVFLNNLYKSIFTISNNKSYHFSWNADPQNMFGKVLIQVDHYPGLPAHDTSINLISVKSLVYTVNDNGNFVIPAADLQRFPVSSYISISISRASDNIWPTDKSQVEFIAVSASTSAPILIKN
ncbi:MAG: hypothetical protein ABI416_03625 [Ginsengibacter sp.]